MLVLLASVGLLAVSLGTAEAGKSKRVERTVQSSYGAYQPPFTGCNDPLGSYACLQLPTRPTEAFFTATVVDTHGQPVAVDVYSGRYPIVSFCGKITRPIDITPYSRLDFHIGLGVGSLGWKAGCPGRIIKTTGTITVKLSNQR